jgi:uncharacterized XkdX family phage protein
MDWFAVAENDWNVYHDSYRIQKFVEFGKITQEQYVEIVGEPYPAL